MKAQPTIIMGIVPTDTDILFFQSSAVHVNITGRATTMTYSATYFLSNLFPATSYFVFCGTRSTSNVAMSSDSMLRSRTPVTTTCCRPLLITLTSTTFSDASNVQSALLIDIAPRDQITIQLIVRHTTKNTAVSPFPPLSSTFPPSDVTLTSTRHTV